MSHTAELIDNLLNKDNVSACAGMKKLKERSAESNEVYEYFDELVNMLDNSNSYVRNRSLILISVNAKWDNDNKLDKIIDKYLSHITDEKPITARQCIKSLPEIVRYKQHLKNMVVSALKNADVEKYNESMKPLIYKDIMSVLNKIEE